jgi:hypothetical protein
LAFIRRRSSGPSSYTHQVIEAVRTEQGPRQRILANLGSSSSIEERLVSLCQQAAELRRDLSDVKKRQAKLAWFEAEIGKLERVRTELATWVDKRRTRAA